MCMCTMCVCTTIYNKKETASTTFFKNCSTRNNYIMNTYDYIIVGAGAAGTVIASRLTTELNKEIPLNILLIEAGNENRTKDMDENMAAQNPMKLWGDKTLTFNDCVVARSTCQPPRSYPVGICVGG